MKPKDFISIVVPCYNEAGNIPTLTARIKAALGAVEDIEYEILTVDDGSSDSTGLVLERCRLENPRIGVIRLVRNFGHQAALSAGLEHVRGDAVIVMDADLQHPPKLLPEMIERWRSGYDVVQAMRRAQPGLAKSLSSRAFYLLLNWLSEVEIPDGAADFRLMSRRTVDSLLALPERTRFLRGLVTWLGFPCTTISFDAPPRQAGSSSYSFRKMCSLALDALVSLSSRPLHLALYAAGLTLLGALLYSLYVVAQLAKGVQLIRGWPSTIFLILILGSVNLLCTGILGLYLRAALVEIRRRPTYLISHYAPSLLHSSQDHPTIQTDEARPFSARSGRGR